MATIGIRHPRLRLGELSFIEVERLLRICGDHDDLGALGERRTELDMAIAHPASHGVHSITIAPVARSVTSRAFGPTRSARALRDALDGDMAGVDGRKPAGDTGVGCSLLTAVRTFALRRGEGRRRRESDMGIHAHVLIAPDQSRTLPRPFLLLFAKASAAREGICEHLLTAVLEQRVADAAVDPVLTGLILARKVAEAVVGRPTER